MNEIWKDIEGYEGLYQVSNQGRVKALAREWTCGRGAIHGHEDIILKPFTTTDKKYYLIDLLKNGKRKTITIHSIIMKIFIGQRPIDNDINHINGIKKDNRLENLEYCTRSENVKHAHRIGIANHCKGERSPFSKLSESQVKEIKRLKGLKSVKEIAKINNISIQAIYKIYSNKTWRHII